ncbi:MAG TPA: TrmH family RNA methyltransferase [Fimbriimonadaceae bacterium]|nr:TrmH family RNA methyltransferase [Fimbriimonadaceae bacterium]
MSTLRKKAKVKKKHRETEPSGIRLCFLLQDWEDAYNVGGMFRIADGCGAEELIMTGRTPIPPNPMIGVTSLGQHRRIPFRTFEKHTEAAETLIAEGWTLVAVEISDNAIPYRDFDYPAQTCLVLGNEGAGIYQALSKLATHTVYIPMRGKGRSLNVTVAAGIVAFEVIRPIASKPDQSHS